MPTKRELATKRTDAADLLTDIVLLVFRLEGCFLEAADGIASPAGLTGARWRVLGAVLDQPRTVADIGRRMGLARQSVQRLADLLVDHGLASYGENAAHRSAKLVAPTKAGLAAVERLRERQASWANAVTEGLSVKRLSECRSMLTELVGRVALVPPANKRL